TVVEVRDLFGNVPARRKFLKTQRTETNHIEETVINTALSRIDLALTYELNGRRIHAFSEAETLEHRLRHVTGIRDEMDLIRITSPGQGGDIGLAGLLLSPEQSRSGGGRLRLFVNNRPVQDRMISHAVAEGMQGFLMKGRRPNGVLFVNLAPEQVDVNVHPAKHEVRFTRPHIVHQIIVQGVSSALEDYQKKIKHSVFSSAAAEMETGRRKAENRKGEEGKREAELSGAMNEEGSLLQAAEEHEAKYLSLSSPGSGTRTLSSPEVGAGENRSPETEEGFLNRLTYIGQFRGSYLLCESRQGLVVIDQHAAHERLLYESLKKQYSKAKLTSQSLLFPEVMECDHERERVLDEHREEIERLGFEIQPFGGKSYAIKAVPVLLCHLGPLEAVEGLFSPYLEQMKTSGKGATRLEDVLAGMACKAAVKANHPLQEMEGGELLKRMQEADIFSHCPHGRPVLKQFSEEEVRKWFYRT
ncbi:MAG: DNA mismatch repair endonuclease MutL, partial [Desulfobia sp.]